jgi:c-di-GMP-binding flagellar brake protein YcgR
MLNDILAIGDKIEIKPLNNEGNPIEGARTYASMLTYIEDDKTIHITAPIVLNNIIHLAVGNKFQLRFYSSKGLLQCTCVALSHYKDNKALIYIVKLTSALTKLQRRQYYRLECIHDIEYSKIEDEIIPDSGINNITNEKVEKIAPKWQKGAIIDISGGGIRFSSEYELHKWDKIKIRLELLISNKIHRMEPEAIVVASGNVINRKDLFEHRVQFSNISKIDREAIIRYIFEQDRLRRKNEKAD